MPVNQEAVYQQKYCIKTVFDAENRTLCFAVMVLEQTVGTLDLKIHSAVWSQA